MLEVFIADRAAGEVYESSCTKSESISGAKVLQRLLGAAPASDCFLYYGNYDLDGSPLKVVEFAWILAPPAMAPG